MFFFLRTDLNLIDYEFKLESISKRKKKLMNGGNVESITLE